MKTPLPSIANSRTEFPAVAVVDAVVAVAVLRAEHLLQPVERPQPVVHLQQRPAQLPAAVLPVAAAAVADAAAVVVAVVAAPAL